MSIKNGECFMPQGREIIEKMRNTLAATKSVKKQLRDS